MTKMMMFAFFTRYLQSIATKYSTSFGLSEKHDPGFLIVSPTYSDMCFTVYDADMKNRTTYAINLAQASIDTLEYQIFHTYYRVVDRGVWFEWVRKLGKVSDYKAGMYDDSGVERIQVIASGLEIHGTKNLIESDEPFKIHAIEGSSYYNIKSNGKCLTVADYRNVERDAFPLFFRPCTNSIEQEFTFVSILKAACLMKSKAYCPDDDKELIDMAEQNVHDRIQRIKAQ